MKNKYRIFDTSHKFIQEINLLPNQLLVRWLVIFLCCSIIPLLIGFYAGKLVYQQDQIVTEKEYVVLTGHKSKPTEKGVKKAIRELNIKFPHIVFAQCELESSHGQKLFSSKLAVENDNLFGMRYAKSRISTADGEQSGFAYYEQGWYYSVLDYAFWQATYASKVTTEDEYLDLLAAVYAEDSLYRNKIKKLSLKHK